LEVAVTWETTYTHVTAIKRNTATPQIKGILGYIYPILPCGQGIIFMIPCGYSIIFMMP